MLPSLTQTSVNVRLNEPGGSVSERVNQIDVTLSPPRGGSFDVRPELAIFNATNANPVLVQVDTLEPSARQCDDHSIHACCDGGRAKF